MSTFYSATPALTREVVSVAADGLELDVVGDRLEVSPERRFAGIRAEHQQLASDLSRKRAHIVGREVVGGGSPAWQ
jgi:hypothetical protein